LNRRPISSVERPAGCPERLFTQTSVRKTAQPVSIRNLAGAFSKEEVAGPLPLVQLSHDSVGDFLMHVRAVDSVVGLIRFNDTHGSMQGETHPHLPITRVGQLRPIPPGLLLHPCPYQRGWGGHRIAPSGTNNFKEFRTGEDFPPTVFIAADFRQRVARVKHDLSAKHQADFWVCIH